MTEAYPLQWPSGRRRTSQRKQGRFTYAVSIAINDVRGVQQKPITVAQACARIMESAAKIRAKGLVISTNLALRGDGKPRSGQAAPDDPGVCVYFNLNGSGIAMPCDTYTEVAQNIAAIAAHIEATRLIERHGVASVREMFSGFAVLPAPQESRWWEILDVSRLASREEIRKAFAAKAKVAHPDLGGSAEEFNRITAAYEASNQ